MFSPINLEWGGKPYSIPANRVLMAIAEIEEVFTLDELQKFNRRGTAPVAKLAIAFGRLLRYAGALVTDDEVYAGMFQGANGETAASATTALLTLMLPPPSIVSGVAGKSVAGKPKKGSALSLNSTSSP